MKKYILVMLFCIGISCKDIVKNTIKTTKEESKKEQLASKINSKKTLDSLVLGIDFKSIENYSTIKKTIQNDRAYFARLFHQNQQKAIDTASRYIYDKLINKIVPHWYGTPWDFNGHTNIPNDGEIACGYFVSTTLKHLGFKLNRYKMAQQGGLNEAITLQPKSELKIYRNISFSRLKTKLNKAYTDGIYFVGLSNHVGYILIKDKDMYFLHSSYCEDSVIIEKAEFSPCFQSDIYVLAEITTNKNLVQKWIQNTLIPIHK